VTEDVGFTRSWPSLAATGAGLIQLAIAAGVVTGAGGESRAVGPGVLAAVLLVLGPAALGWAALVLVRGRIVAARLGMLGSVAGIIALTGMLMVDPNRTSILAVGVAVAFLVITGAACAFHIRRASRGSESGATRTARASAIGVLVGAAAVAALVTPALASTEAGQLAPSHSDHMVVPGHGH
jgi:Na+/melibiose symporter-like transporter